MDRVSAYKKVEQLKWLVQTKSTGSPPQLAQKLEVSERTVYRMLEAARELYQTEIIFSYNHNSYVFVNSSTENDSLPEFGST
jgi:transcriptional antiterminator